MRIRLWRSIAGESGNFFFPSPLRSIFCLRKSRFSVLNLGYVVTNKSNVLNLLVYRFILLTCSSTHDIKNLKKNTEWCTWYNRDNAVNVGQQLACCAGQNKQEGEREREKKKGFSVSVSSLSLRGGLGMFPALFGIMRQPILERSPPPLSHGNIAAHP